MAALSWRLIGLTFAIVVSVYPLTRCRSKIENQPLGQHASNLERRKFNFSDKTQPTVVLAFSGGGARAAALGYEVLQLLRKTTYVTATGQHNLLDDVAVISSVSGGSVTAAWFGLHPDNLDALKSQFFNQNNMLSLMLTAANPVTWGRMLFTDFTRITALEELLDRRLFNQHIMADLNESGKPKILLNATDMAAGQRFTFDTEMFDAICSDLDSLPISVAVSASAAFPILLTPVNLQNFSGSRCRGTVSRDFNYWNDIAMYGMSDHTRRLSYLNDLRKNPNRFRDIDYIHLLDEGLSDNLGIATLGAVLFATDYPPKDATILDALSSGKLQKLVIIVVNAGSDVNNKLAQQKETPGLWEVFKSVTSVPIDVASGALNEQMKYIASFISIAQPQVYRLVM